MSERPAARGLASRRLVSQALLAFHLMVAPASFPIWRLDPERRPVAMLSVGEPVTPLWTRRDRGTARAQ